MSSGKSSLHLKDNSAANSLEAEHNCPASTTHLRGIKGHEIKLFWSLIHPGLQGFLCNLLLELKYLTRQCRKFRKVFHILISVRMRQSALQLWAKEFSSARKICLYYRTKVRGGMRPFNCQSFLKGIKLLVFLWKHFMEEDLAWNGHIGALQWDT